MFLLYTCLLDDYDSLKPIIIKGYKFECICITNNEKLVKRGFYRGWKTIKPGVNGSPSFINRYYKMNPWILGDYIKSLYIDSSVYLKNYWLMEIDQKADIAVFKHNKRVNPKQEYKYLKSLENLGIRRFGIDDWPIKELNDSLGEDSLFWGGFIYRKHNDKVKKAMNYWWDSYVLGITRDQITLPYVISKNNLELQIISGIKDKLFVFPHKKRGSVYSRILDICSHNHILISIFISMILPIRKIIK
jgi:hypothetical protein